MRTSAPHRHQCTAVLPLAEDALRCAYGASRVSPARRAIAKAVVAMPGAFTVENLHARAAGSSDGVGLATVYRAVAAMLDSGFVATVGTRAGVALYARCAGGDHHHHLVCTGCGTVAPVDCPLDRAVLAAADRSGYTITGHEVVLYGLCSACVEGCTAAPGDTP
ncbi:MAG TPA: transcriptional repressor [Coriobacteriia bacterium]|nr:transcriptional repressor [Coriobacteriia bacterium]